MSQAVTLPQNSRPARAAPEAAARRGLFYGLGAYTMWGVFPLYFRALAEVQPFVILCHRICWSALLLAIVVSARGEWAPIRPVLRERRSVFLLTIAATLIAANWLIFIYAVTSGQVLQASLGYFINPLVSIALGVIFLRERLRGRQWLAVGIAGAAVANLAFRAGALPWIAISLALTFAFYGLVRKKVDVNPLHSLLVETVILLPVAAAALALMPAARATSAPALGLLSLSGVITAVPLLLFGAAVRRLRLSTVGFLQYIGPTLQFILALAVFHEPLSRAKLASFGLCWLGIGVFVLDSLLAGRSQVVADEPD